MPHDQSIEQQLKIDKVLRFNEDSQLIVHNIAIDSRSEKRVALQNMSDNLLMVNDKIQRISHLNMDGMSVFVYLFMFIFFFVTITLFNLYLGDVVVYKYVGNPKKSIAMQEREIDKVSFLVALEMCKKSYHFIVL